MKDDIWRLCKEFSSETHGASDYDKDKLFIAAPDGKSFAPLSFLKKKSELSGAPEELLSQGLVYSSFDFLDGNEQFESWYQHQFSKKLSTKDSKNIGILTFPNQKSIFESVEKIHQCYEVLRTHDILLNGKNLPVQLGEWYAKSIFGLKQAKSSSQRGFDFLKDQKERVEVKVHWSDFSSPKGVKLKKSLVELARFCIIVYVAKNFMIRDILYLDSDFILRKLAGKGHTVFLKDSDVGQYFFSKSSKHFDKVVNKNALMKFSTPTLAMKLDGRLPMAS